jgi:hypothetical protein
VAEAFPGGQRSNIASTWSVSNGLVRKSSAPAPRHSVLVAVLIKLTGTLAVSSVALEVAAAASDIEPSLWSETLSSLAKCWDTIDWCLRG